MCLATYLFNHQFQNTIEFLKKLKRSQAFFMKNTVNSNKEKIFCPNTFYPYLQIKLGLFGKPTAYKILPLTLILVLIFQKGIFIYLHKFLLSWL